MEEVVVKADAAVTVDGALKSDSIVVFGKSACPFCTEVERTLNERVTKQGGHYAYYRLDRLDNGAALHADLKAKTKQATVPYVFVDGVLIGGCRELKAGEFDGSLVGILGAVPPEAVAADLSAPRTLPGTLFLFPNTADSRVARIVGLLVSSLSVLAAVLGVIHKTAAAGKWIALGIFVDFLFRFCFGPHASALGATAAMIAGMGERLLGSQPRFIPALPKQFAALVGCTFSGLGALFFFLAKDNGTWARWLAFAWLVGLAGAAFLEGALNFCAACWMFSHGIRLGLVPPTVHIRFINEQSDVRYTWQDWNKRLNEKELVVGTKTFPMRGALKSRVDPVWKEKTDDQRRESCHPVRNFHAMYWSMPLSLSALALVFFYATQLARSGDTVAPHIHATVYRVLAIFAIIVWCFFFILQALRVVLFPKKVWKEWTCPVRVTAFLFPTMCLLMYVLFALVDSRRRLALALFWTAAPLQLAISIYIVGLWVYYLRGDEHVSAVWLAVPLCNVFAAVAWVALFEAGTADLLTSAAQIWMGFAVLYFVAVFPVAVHRVVMGHNMDVFGRSTHWMVVAAPAVLALGWQTVVSPGAALSAPFTMLFFGSVVLLAVLLYGIYPMRFYLTGPWDMGQWAVGFTLSAVAACTIVYNGAVRTGVSEVMQIVALVAACLANWISLNLFVRDVFTFKVFVAGKGPMPLMFMKLSHEAFRGLMPKLKAALSQADPRRPASLKALLRVWDDYAFLTRVHMQHEDSVIFPQANEYMPHHSDPFHEEHEEDERIMAQLRPLFAQLAAGMEPHGLEGKGDGKSAELGGDAPIPNVLAAMTPLLTHGLDFIERHLKHEEMRLSPIMRKNNSIEAMRQTIQEIWRVTDSLDMFRFIPLIVNNLQRHPQRLQFVRILLWSLPDRGAQIGTMLSLGIDPVLWQRLADEIPDIIPRGVRGWHKHG